MWWIRELGVGARARSLMFECLLPTLARFIERRERERVGGSRSGSRGWGWGLLCVRGLRRS